MRTIALTETQVEMLRSAIDSHIYWQLSERQYRDDGDVIDPGSDEPEDVAEIIAFRHLDELLAGT